MRGSSISFSENAANNILFCGPGVTLSNTKIAFNGSNSVVYLCGSKKDYKLSVSLNNDNVLFIGSNNYFNGPLNIVLSEQKHCLIGNDCLFSFGIWIRTADPHLIYSAETRQRLNPSKSVFIGDHVWVGQSALLLKGTQIDSGSIIGAGSVVSGKTISHNCSCAGNPCRILKENIFWEGSCVHSWTQPATERSQSFDTLIADRPGTVPDAYLFSYDPAQSRSFSNIDDALSGGTAQEKMFVLDALAGAREKNRFVHTPSQKKAGFFSFFSKNK